MIIKPRHFEDFDNGNIVINSSKDNYTTFEATPFSTFITFF